MNNFGMHDFDRAKPRSRETLNRRAGAIQKFDSHEDTKTQGKVAPLRAFVSSCEIIDWRSAPGDRPQLRGFATSRVQFLGVQS
jgi:hypothetical protein